MTEEEVKVAHKPEDGDDNNDHLNSDYKLKSYWDSRFEAEDQYDWLVKCNDIQQYIVPKMTSKDAKILIVGCGNSSFSADLYDCGYKNIINIDFSEVCIARMQQKHAESRPEMSWVTMDMTELLFHDQEFDIVIDKASMDALLVDEGDVWDPEESTISIVDKMCAGISRVLKPGGLFLQITFAQTHFRTKYLQASHVLKSSNQVSPFESLKGYCDRYNWTLDYTSVNPTTGCIHYYIYHMIKG